MAYWTKAVVAICSLLSSAAGVGAFGVPVKVGLSKSALASSTASTTAVSSSPVTKFPEILFHNKPKPV
jgi:hypothetical protein